MRRILVIDDSAVQRILARAILQEADFDVLEATDGEAGLSLARVEPVDGILLDWLMPGTSGSDVLRIMREERISIPVIVVTSAPDDKIREECAQLGAAAVIDKPRNAEDLLSVLTEVLGPGS